MPRSSTSMQLISSVDDYVVGLHEPATSALEALEKNHLGFVVVLSKDSVAQGVITDGDIRRGLLNGMSLEKQCSSFMNNSFSFILEDENPYEKKELIESYRFMPVLNGSGQLKGIYSFYSDHEEERQGMSTPVIILAGGQGRRLRPLTKKCPKPLLQVGQSSILEILLGQLKQEGFKDFYLSVNYLKDEIINKFGSGQSLGLKIRYLEEEEPLGTAGPLSLLPASTEGEIIIVNGDILTKLCLSKMLRYHRENNSIATIGVREVFTTSPYGVINCVNGTFTGCTEKPTTRELVSAGIYIINRSCLKRLSYSKYMDMPDFLNELVDGYSKIQVYPIHEYWRDIGRLDSLEAARREWPVL